MTLTWGKVGENREVKMRKYIITGASLVGLLFGYLLYLGTYGDTPHPLVGDDVHDGYSR